MLIANVRLKNYCCIIKFDENNFLAFFWHEKNFATKKGITIYIPSCTEYSVLISTSACMVTKNTRINDLHVGSIHVLYGILSLLPI